MAVEGEALAEVGDGVGYCNARRALLQCRRRCIRQHKERSGSNYLSDLR